MFANAFIIVWRESLEAMLIIGILSAWITTQPDAARLRSNLWSGVVAGVGLAIALAVLTFKAQFLFDGMALEAFQIGLLFLACALVTHMVLWMHAHGHRMKRQFEQQAQAATGRMGLALVAALAVAREGAETALFLYGTGVQGSPLVEVAGGTLAGFAAALVVAFGIARGSRLFPMRHFFGATEILLLLIAGAMLANGIDRLLGMDWVPAWGDMVWDSSNLLDDSQGAGRMLADFAGYRARPTGILLAAYAAYWSFVVWRLSRASATK